jgi:hypothetical protein
MVRGFLFVCRVPVLINVSYPSYPRRELRCAQQLGRVRWWVDSLVTVPAPQLNLIYNYG